MDNFDPDDPRASYQLVADAIAARIADGTYAVGAKLPPHQEIADQFGVSVGTVKRAYSLLQDSKLITTRQGMGTFVRQQAPAPETRVGAVPATLEDVFAVLADLTARLEAVESQLRTHG
ncbi:GntR family transcriptional regulator [Amycolatopsis sp. NPDC001319]|uniref:GntR family transcriptional regulator n=1 Tax=unclassified Amycolatopsis TaxID=2618356 RepID=UPI0036C8B3A1